MKSKILIGSRVNSAAVFLLSIGLIFFSFLFTETGLKNVVSVDIPLASTLGLRFPIPVFFWAGVIIYLFFVAKLTNSDFKNVLRRGVLLGFFIHFTLLLLNLSGRSAAGEIYWFSNMYQLYFKVFLYLGLCGLGIWSGIILRILVSGKNNAPYACLVYALPLFFVYSLAAVFIQRDYLLLSAAFGAFIVAFFARGREGIYLKIWEKVSLLSEALFRERVFLALVFIAAMFFRVFFLSRTMSDPGYLDTASDGPALDNYAVRFLAGEPVGAPQAKGYWVILAGIYALFGRNHFVVGVIQSILGAAAVVIMYLIVKRGFGNAAARIAAIAGAVNYMLISSAAGIGHQATDLFYGVLIVYLLIKAKETAFGIKTLIILALAGIICGIATATREVNVLLPLFLAGWLIYTFSKLRLPPLKITVSIVLLLFFSVLGLAPFLYLNYIYSGSLYDQSSTYGMVFVLEQYNPHLTAIGFEPWRDFGRSLQVFAAKPLVFLKAAWLNYYTKFIDLYFNQGYGGFDPVFLVRKPPTDYFLIMWFYAYLITAVGLVSLFMRRLKRHIRDFAVVWLVLLVITYKTAFHLFTIAVARYRAPIEPFLIMLAAYGLYVIIQFANRKT